MEAAPPVMAVLRCSTPPRCFQVEQSPRGTATLYFPHPSKVPGAATVGSRIRIQDGP